MLHPKIEHIYKDMICEEESACGLYRIKEIINEFDSEDKFVILEQLEDSKESGAGTLWIISPEELGRRIVLNKDTEIADNWYKKGTEVYRFMLIQ